MVGGPQRGHPAGRPGGEGRCGTVPASSPFAAEVELAGRLAALHPGDVGVVVALLLNRLVLQPGQAIYAPAGRIHAYIRGAGVELMANSDNVIRAGLTRKRVDLIELAKCCG